MRRGDRLVGAQHHRTQDHVFEFAHIAGPGVGQQLRLRLRVDAVGLAVGRVARQQARHQRKDVARAFAQARHAQLEGADAKVQVFAELAQRDRAAQVLVGRGDHAQVELDGTLAAEAHQRTFLQHAQQLGLQLHRHFSNLVEKQRPALRLLEQAAVQVQRAGEGALFVTEQHVLDHLLGHCRAVQPHEGPACAGRRLVQHARQHFLARSGRALYQHRHIGLGYPLRQRQQMAADRVHIDDAARRRRPLGLCGVRHL